MEKLLYYHDEAPRGGALTHDRAARDRLTAVARPKHFLGWVRFRLGWKEVYLTVPLGRVYRWSSGRAGLARWPGVPCRAMPAPGRTVPSCRPSCASCRGYGPRHGPWAIGPARRHGGPPGQGRARPVVGLYFLFLFRISRLHFLTGQLGWMDGSTDLHFPFFRIKKLYFLLSH